MRVCARTRVVLQSMCACAVLYRIRRDFPWLNLMGWLFREITVEDAHGNVVASVTRNWHPFYRKCGCNLGSNRLFILIEHCFSAIYLLKF